MENDERDLIAGLVHGDPTSFAALYDLHSPVVHRFIWSLLGDRDLAADAVQETFLIAWRRRRSIRLAADSLLPWLLATARYVAMNEMRRQRRHPTVELDGLGLSANGPEVWAEARVRLARVLRQIKGLEDLDRQILQLCVFDGLTYEQAARRLHISATAVGKRIERSRKRLRAPEPRRYGPLGSNDG